MKYSNTLPNMIFAARKKIMFSPRIKIILSKYSIKKKISTIRSCYALNYIRESMYQKHHVMENNVRWGLAALFLGIKFQKLN